MYIMLVKVRFGGTQKYVKVAETEDDYDDFNTFLQKGWDSDLSSILLLVHLLPPTSKGHKMLKSVYVKLWTMLDAALTDTANSVDTHKVGEPSTSQAVSTDRPITTQQQSQPERDRDACKSTEQSGAGGATTAGGSRDPRPNTRTPPAGSFPLLHWRSQTVTIEQCTLVFICSTSRNLETYSDFKQQLGLKVEEASVCARKKEGSVHGKQSDKANKTKWPRQRQRSATSKIQKKQEYLITRSNKAGTYDTEEQNELALREGETD
ncbi:hypothetical protein PAMP_003332 [Pampus punctatissimus]